MSEYEKQVVSLIKFKSDDYVERQDYLAALIKAADKWLSKNDESGDIFDGWDNELASWFDEAVHAMNAKRKIPDFPDVELGEEDKVPDEGEADDESPDAPDADETEPETGDIEAVDESGGEELRVEEKPNEAPKKSNARKTGPRAAKVRGQFNNVTADAVETTSRDRFGVLIHTKTHDAVLMFEKGCSMREVEETIGGKHYNVIKALLKRGHRIEKFGNIFKLTHADDLEK